MGFPQTAKLCALLASLLWCLISPNRRNARLKKERLLWILPVLTSKGLCNPEDPHSVNAQTAVRVVVSETGQPMEKEEKVAASVVKEEKEAVASRGEKVVVASREEKVAVASREEMGVIGQVMRRSSSLC